MNSKFDRVVTHRLARFAATAGFDYENCCVTYRVMAEIKKIVCARPDGEEGYDHEVYTVLDDVSYSMRFI